MRSFHGTRLCLVTTSFQCICGRERKSVKGGSCVGGLLLNNSRLADDTGIIIDNKNDL